MNPVLHGTLKRVFAFLGNLVFWPLTLLFLAISGWKQAGAAIGLSLVGLWIAKKVVIIMLLPMVAYAYLATGLVTALVFGYLFGTFKNAVFVYPTLVVFGAWVGVILSILLT